MIFVLVLFGVPALFLGLMNIWGILAGFINLLDGEDFDVASWVVANWFMAMLVTICGGIAYAAYTYM